MNPPCLSAADATPHRLQVRQLVRSRLVTWGLTCRQNILQGLQDFEEKLKDFSGNSNDWKVLTRRFQRCQAE